MNTKKYPSIFKLSDVPEYQAFIKNNPDKCIDGLETAIVFGRAIHWMAFLEVLWPPFEEVDFYMVEVRYLVWNDPDNHELPEAFFIHMVETLRYFWTMQLNQILPNGDWEIETDQSELLIQVTIKNRNDVITF